MQPRRIVHRRITTDVDHRPQPIGNKRRVTFASTGVKCSVASTASTSKSDDIDTFGIMSEPSELITHQNPVLSITPISNAQNDPTTPTIHTKFIEDDKKCEYTILTCFFGINNQIIACWSGWSYVVLVVLEYLKTPKKYSNFSSKRSIIIIRISPRLLYLFHSIGSRAKRNEHNRYGFERASSLRELFC